MATVDVIIPLYNKSRTIERAIKSILDQTFTDWRIIVIDDGSTDEGPERVWQFNDDRIRMIQQENAGPGAARNRGIAEATAEYVAFLDADDEWYRWYLENALNAITDSNVSFVGSMYEDHPNNINMTDFWAKKGVFPMVGELDFNTSLRQAMRTVSFFHVGCTLVRTSIAQKYGGFYDKEKCLLGEDSVFSAKLALNERFAIIGPAAVRHNRDDSDLSNMAQHPISIFLHKPHIVLDYCLPEKKEYASEVLLWHAWNTAHFRARAGLKADAVYLQEKFPQMKKFGFQYVRLCFEIHLSRWFPCWIKFKILLAAPIKKLT